MGAIYVLILVVRGSFNKFQDSLYFTQQQTHKNYNNVIFQRTFPAVQYNLPSAQQVAWSLQHRNLYQYNVEILGPCWSRLGGFPTDCWVQLIRKQRNVIVCIQSNPRRYKIDKNKSLAVPEDAEHDLPCWWMNFEFLGRRRCHVLSAVAKTSTPFKYTWTRQSSLNTAASRWWISALVTPSATRNLIIIRCSCCMPTSSVNILNNNDVINDIVIIS